MSQGDKNSQENTSAAEENDPSDANENSVENEVIPPTDSRDNNTSSSNKQSDDSQSQDQSDSVPQTQSVCDNNISHSHNPTNMEVTVAVDHSTELSLETSKGNNCIDMITIKRLTDIIKTFLNC